MPTGRPTARPAAGRAGGARILMATAGTWGDLFPFIALGLRLKDRGHDVTLACSTGLQPWVVRSGLKTATFGGAFGKEWAQKSARIWDHWNEDGGRSENSGEPARYSALIDLLERNCRELAPLARRADLLLTPSNCPEGRLIREMTGTPWLSVILTPDEALRENRPAEDRELLHAMSRLKRRLGLSPSVTSHSAFRRSDPTLFACSAAMGDASLPEIRQTGFWFYEDPRWQDWRPDALLLRFMEADADPPLLLSFSSLPLENPAQALEAHLRAARLLDRRIVVQQGWSGFSPEQIPPDLDADRIYMTDFLPHDWFLSRAAALITHGGAGTLGRALRNACPMVVEPYGNDQFFNAWVVRKRGYGSAVHPHRLTAEGLASVLSEIIADGEARARAASASAMIRREDGPGKACAVIEECIGVAGSS